VIEALKIGRLAAAGNSKDDELTVPTRMIFSNRMKKAGRVETSRSQTFRARRGGGPVYSGYRLDQICFLRA